jgi:AcrR family transcriptional regulator
MSIRTAEVRRARVRERARTDILLAAAGVFARRGYAAATLAELAEAAGYAAPSLYRYFQGKEEIFQSLVDLLVAEMSATFEEPVDRTLSLGDRLAALFSAQHRLSESHRPILDLMLSSAGTEARGRIGGRPIGDPHAGLAFYEERMEDWLRRNVARRELRLSPDLAARAISGLVFAFRPVAPETPAEPARRTHTVIDLILHGVAP